MHDDDEVTVNPPWWLAVEKARWANALGLLSEDPGFWTAFFRQHGPGSVRVFSGDPTHLHVLLPDAVRGSVRTWLTQRGLRLTEDPERNLEYLPVYVAELTVED